jgi:hypothetical protein
MEETAMRRYVGLTAALFALLTVVHVWRAVVEPGARTPWFGVTTVLSAALCLWAIRLYRRTPSSGPGRL